MKGVGTSLKGRFRSRLSVYTCILEVSKFGVMTPQKTLKETLRDIPLAGYLRELEAKGFLEKVGDTYRTTQKGLSFLRDYSEYESLSEEMRKIRSRWPSLIKT